MGKGGGAIEVNGRAEALGVAIVRLGRARGVGSARAALGVPCGVDAERVGDELVDAVPDPLRALSSWAFMPMYLLARESNGELFSVLIDTSGATFFRALVATGRGAGAWDGVVRPEREGVARPP
jgi:hypothetical protein